LRSTSLMFEDMSEMNFSISSFSRNEGNREEIGLSADPSEFIGEAKAELILLATFTNKGSSRMCLGLAAIVVVAYMIFVRL